MDTFVAPEMPQIPSMPQPSQAAQKTADDFNAFQAPAQDQGKYQAPQEPTTAFNTGTTAPPKPSAAPGYIDSSSSAFSGLYSGLTIKQKEIVDAMAEKLDIMDLFKKRRFFLKWTIIPKKLVVDMRSQLSDEMKEFWESLAELKGSDFAMRCVIAVKGTARTVYALNNSVLPESLEEREKMLAGFDHTFINLLSDYVNLFEIARMKLLHGGDLVTRPFTDAS
jgi:hypothetical protein